MIEQYLSNTNEIATVLILPKILELRPCLVPEKFCKIFQILRHIESLGACMKY